MPMTSHHVSMEESLGFMQAAFAAYIRANPAARERIEATHLLAQLDDMRRRGVLATA